MSNVVGVILSQAVVEIIVIFILSVIIGTIIPLVLYVLVQRDKLLQIVVVLTGLALVGASAGVAGGMSRVGAVGSVIPAFLGLLGGLAVYLFGIDRTKGLVSSFGAAALSLALITSYTLGAQYRNVGDDHRNIRSVCAQAYTDWELLSNEVAYEKFVSKFEGLCDASMFWHITE